MTKPLSYALLDHYQKENQTITRCVRIERRDGVVIGLTDHDADLVVQGILYKSAVGYTPTAIQANDNLSVNNIDVEGILAVAGVGRDDIAGGLFDYARVYVFEVNYKKPTYDIMPLVTGFWGESKLQENKYTTEFRSLSQALQQKLGELYSITCRANLGDSRCKANLASFTVSGTVNDVTNKAIFSASTFAQDSGYFQFGLLTWTTGNNTSYSMEVKVFTTGGGFQLVQPMPNTIEVGDTFHVYAGCNKAIATCKAKFNNVVNFRGEPFVPGIDKMLSYPNAK
ncbi:MAG: DUF2163 domain-containing protein [Gammaproteobacteria bacterium]|nr:DUF2163 domain-containing protein [Gammaproteobacteria bacterium]